MRKLLANAAFHRANIADDSARGENRRDPLQEVGVGAERRGENEQVGVARRIFQRTRDATLGKQRDEPRTRSTAAVVEREAHAGFAGEKIVCKRATDVSNTDNADVADKGSRR